MKYGFVMRKILLGHNRNIISFSDLKFLVSLVRYSHADLKTHRIPEISPFEASKSIFRFPDLSDIVIML